MSNELQKEKLLSGTFVASTFDYAAFSLDVYRDKNRPSLPEGWKLLCDCPVEYQVKGYFGAVYYSADQEDRTAQLVLAHRGTSNKPDLWEDIWYLLIEKDTPAQFYSGAVPFIKYVMDFAGDFFSDTTVENINIDFTGHSLGATLAEISTPYVTSQFPSPVKKQKSVIWWGNAVTFESPGSNDILKKMVERNEVLPEYMNSSEMLTLTYNADVNAINSTMSHGHTDLSSLNILYSWVSLSDGTYPIAPTFLYFLINFSINDQHSMQKMYSYWLQSSKLENKQEIASVSLDEWPSNPWAGYVCYSTYRGEQIATFHNHYWESQQQSGNKVNGYISRVWDTHPELHLEFDSYEKFHKKYVEDLMARAIKLSSHKQYENADLSTLVEIGKKEVQDMINELEEKNTKEGGLSAFDKAKLNDCRKLAEEYKSEISKILGIAK